MLFTVEGELEPTERLSSYALKSSFCVASGMYFTPWLTVRPVTFFMYSASADSA